MKRKFAALLCALLLLTGCAAGTKEDPTQTMRLYLPQDVETAQGGDVLTSVTLDWSGQKDAPVEEQAALLIDLLLEGRPAANLLSPIPRGTRLNSCTIQNGSVWVDFSPAYGQLSGMDLTVADYCIALTLTQLENVYIARITVDGSELAYRDSNRFTAGDVLLTSTEDVVRSVAVRLYFPDAETGVLSAEQRLLTVYEGTSQAEVLLTTLIGGPEVETLAPLLPEGFEVLTVRTEEGVCYLNLPGTTAELMDSDGDEQQKMVQGIVNSLCSLSGIRTVQILLDGELAPLLGSVDISQPLSRSIS